jgi:UDP-N-acetylglucosamine 2-epimerase
MAPVYRALVRRHGIDPVVCLTGQHREMVEQILPQFDVKPAFDLDIMVPGQSPTQVAAAILSELPAIFQAVRPQLVLVQGDTTTAMAAAIAAHYAEIPIGHVEAGLRTGSLQEPFPEEANRKIISAITRLHFAPTARAADTLRAENVSREWIYLTGNTVVDALLFLKSRISPVDSTGIRRIIVTAHRRESFGPPIRSICRALGRIADENADVEIVYPVHPNPNVRIPVYSILSRQDRIRLLDPQTYFEFLGMLAGSYLALTDSGGIQEEAPALGVPVLVMRERTERPEAIEAGCAKLVGTDEHAIVAATNELLRDSDEHARMSRVVSPFGDGLASDRIARIICEFLDVESPHELSDDLAVPSAIQDASE